MDRVTVDPARLQAVDDRLRLYTDLARKYGGSTEAAVAYLDEATARLALLEQGEEDLARLEEARPRHDRAALWSWRPRSPRRAARRRRRSRRRWRPSWPTWGCRRRS